jgi:hypothetical protein
MDLKLIQTYEFDERFYQRTDKDGNVLYAPSVTFVLQDSYPTEYSLIKWIGDLGNEKAEVVRDQAAEAGSFVHEMIEDILKGGKIASESINARFKPKASLHVKRCLKSFLDWFNEYQPKVIETEKSYWHESNRFAGTIDLICEIKGEQYIIDLKTSNSIHTTNFLQICAYGQIVKAEKLAVLHLGNITKKHFTFNVLDDGEIASYTKQFFNTLEIFELRHPHPKPTSETFPEWFEIKPGVWGISDDDEYETKDN